MLRTHLDDTFGIAIVVLLILLTAFFVAAEFAIVKIRSTRLDELIKQGNKRAAISKKIINDLNAYLSTTQLGITVTALVLGWIGEPAVAHLFNPLFKWVGLNSAMTHTLSVISGFFLITFISVVLGELAPKGIAIHKAEQITLAIAYPLIWAHRLLFPFVWLLNTLSNSVIRLFGIKPEGEHGDALTEGELRLTLADSFKSGEISQGELRYMTRIFDFDERTAREIMVPRTEIVCIYQEDQFEESLQILQNEKYTRFPVVEEDKDHVVGMINIKDLFTDVLNKEIQTLDHYIRPILSVLETTPIRTLLEKMQKESIHMAILTDEYGGTSGLVTVEDILEEIVGEIRDEYDEGEEPLIKRIDPDKALVDGKLLISHVNQQFQIDIEEEGIDTIGGWMLAEDPNVKVGSKLNYDHVTFEVTEMEAHQIRKIMITKIKTLHES
ncbi:hemolysin family protein [Sporolactobacillus laevolacticus]|uniref:hemolysin family protein n=1 Tax=Sporolactobacillus laevolacticus TaxID=33018 RepID=UPI0025B3C2C7|nr:hemolysin family protein [Sporolactobacillus laevolacticus]MDN3954163.1 hemolysin family protein [Sporolactobacillus laevolacticus]